MDRALLKMLYFGLVGLLIAGSIITVFQTTPVIAKEGTVSVYFTGIASDIQGDPNVPVDVAAGAGRPGVDLLSLTVTIDSVSVHQSGADDESGWTEISNIPITVDVLRSTDVTTLIAMGPVPEQNITMVRLHVTGATAAVSDSGAVSSMAVLVSNGELKIPLGSARVTAQLNTSIAVTGKVNIVFQGNDMIRLTPVLHVDRVTGPK